MDIGGSTAGQLPHREPWADQQDSPEGSKAPISTNLLGLEEDEPRAEEGAASGAPIAELPVRRYGDFVNPIDDPDASIFARSDPANQEQVEAPQPPPEAVLTKEELEAAVGVEAAASALESLVVTGEPSGAATTEPSAPVVEGIEENEFGVDYGGDEEDVEVEGEAPSAPPTDAEAAEQPNQQRQRRGTKAGKHVQQKEATKTFHNVGYPAARDWLRDFTARNCGGTPFRLDKPSFRPNPDYSPLVRLITAFSTREARFDPLLVLARLQNYIPALQKYIGHRNRDLLSDIHQRARDSRQQFRGQPRGADPLDRFEDPVRETRVNLKPDIGGLGAQYVKQQASEERARRQQDPPAKAPATPFGWHPTLNRGQGSGSQKPPEPDLPPKSTAAASTDSVPLQPQPPQQPPEEHQSGKPARARSPPVSPRGRSAGKGTPKVPVVLKPAADKASLRKSSAPSRPKAEKIAVEKRAASAPSSSKAKGTSPIRKVFLQKKLVPTPPSTPPPGTPAKGAASGAPSPTSVAEPKQVQSKGERTPAEKRKSSTSGSDRERTRSEPVRQSRQKRLRASAPSKPLVLRSRTGDQVTRTDESGTWALITPADPSKVGTTTISGERAARRVRSGEETETYTREKWTVGPKTTLISYASEDSSSSEELLPAEEGQDRPPTRQQRQRPRSPSSESSSSSHRSTSSGSQAQLPRGKREEPDILQGTIEAPIADIEPRQPAQRPPQEKRQRVQFGRRDIPTVQSTPLAKTAARQQGAAAPVAHQATTPAATEVKQEGKAKKSKPPPKAPTTVAAEDRERSRSTTNKVPYKPPPAIQSKGISQSSPPPAQTWFRNTNPPPLEPQSIPERPKRAPPSPATTAQPGKAPPQKVLEQRAREAAAEGAASGAPSSASGGLAPHRDPSPPRDIPPVPPRRYFDTRQARAEDIRFGHGPSFKVALDWHGVLDKLVDDFGVLEERPLQLIQALNTRHLPVEFVILSFAGQERSEGLEDQLRVFIGDAIGRGLPFSGFRITRERCGPAGKADALAGLGLHALVDDTDYIVRECARTGAFAYHQAHHQPPTDWIFWFQSYFANWKGGLEALCNKHRAVKLRPNQYANDPKKSGRR